LERKVIVHILLNMHKSLGEGNFCNAQRKLKNLSLLQTTINTWVTLTKWTEWLIAK